MNAATRAEHRTHEKIGIAKPQDVGTPLIVYYTRGSCTLKSKSGGSTSLMKRRISSSFKVIRLLVPTSLWNNDLSKEFYT